MPHTLRLFYLVVCFLPVFVFSHRLSCVLIYDSVCLVFENAARVVVASFWPPVACRPNDSTLCGSNCSLMMAVATFRVFASFLSRVGSGLLPVVSALLVSFLSLWYCFALPCSLYTPSLSIPWLYWCIYIHVYTRRKQHKFVSLGLGC